MNNITAPGFVEWIKPANTFKYWRKQKSKKKPNKYQRTMIRVTLPSIVRQPNCSATPYVEPTMDVISVRLEEERGRQCYVEIKSAPAGFEKVVGLLRWIPKEFLDDQNGSARVPRHVLEAML